MTLSLCVQTTTQTWAAGSPALNSARSHYATPNSPPTLITKPKLQIAIIIDDLGYNRRYGELAATLPGAVTLSVLPHSPYGRNIAQQGSEHGKEIMLHAPMSSVLDKPLDPGGLTKNMSKAQFVATLKAGLAAVPGIVGVNNHMGSELTQDRRAMNWLMQELRSRDLYFVDSRTIASSLAWETAQHHGLATTRRDVFLDHDSDTEAIAKQFDKLLRIAKHHGQAVAIAHPYPETLEFLQNALPLLDQAQIELVPVSAILSPPVASSSSTEPGLVRKRRADRPREIVGPTTFLSK